MKFSETAQTSVKSKDRKGVMPIAKGRRLHKQGKSTRRLIRKKTSVLLNLSWVLSRLFDGADGEK